MDWSEIKGALLLFGILVTAVVLILFFVNTIDFIFRDLLRNCKCSCGG